MVVPNNFQHKAGDGSSTRQHHISEISPALQANCGTTQQSYVLEVLSVGYIEKGTGPHQSNQVYSTSGVAPTLASQYLTNILEIKDER